MAEKDINKFHKTLNVAYANKFLNTFRDIHRYFTEGFNSMHVKKNFFEANRTPSGKKMVTLMQVDNPVRPVNIQITTAHSVEAYIATIEQLWNRESNPVNQLVCVCVCVW